MEEIKSETRYFLCPECEEKNTILLSYLISTVTNKIETKKKDMVLGSWCKKCEWSFKIDYSPYWNEEQGQVDFRVKKFLMDNKKRTVTLQTT